VRRHRSSERTIFSTTQLVGRTSGGESRDQLQARIGLRCPHCPKLLFLCPGHVVAGRGRSSSTDRSVAQSSYRPRTGSRKSSYARSLRGSSVVAPGHRTATKSRQIGMMAHRILTHKMSCTPHHTPPPHRSRGCRILRYTTCSQLHCYHIPLTHEVLQVLLHDRQRGSTQLPHGSGGKER
jgi:hypothetical protein